MRKQKLILSFVLVLAALAFSFSAQAVAKVVSGDAVEIGSTSDLLEINEPMGNVRAQLTRVDIDALQDFTLTVDNTNVTVKQYLRFPEDYDSPGKVVFDSDERDRVGHFLFYKMFNKDRKSESEIFTFELEFEGGLRIHEPSELIGKKLFILGEEFTITFFDIADYFVLFELQSNTKIISYGGDGIVNHPPLFEENEFNITLAEEPEKGVKINGKDIQEAEIHLDYTKDSEDFILNSIFYSLYANAHLGDLYVIPGKGVREHLKNPEAMLSDHWDIRYEGLMDTGVTLVRIDSAGNDEYDLEYTNQEGIFFDVPLASNEVAAIGLKYGDDNDDLWFQEDNTTFQVSRQDFFLLSDCRADPYNDITGLTDDTCFSHVLRYDNIDPTNSRLTFTDLGTGTVEIPYNATTGVGELYIGGVTYKLTVNIGNHNLRIDLNGDGIISPPEDIRGKALIGIQGEGLIDLGFETANIAVGVVGVGYGPANVSLPLNKDFQPCNKFTDMYSPWTPENNTCKITISLITLQKEFDEALGDEVLGINITGETPNRIHIVLGSPFLSNMYAEATGYWSGMLDLEENEDLAQGLSGYGVFAELYDPASNDQAEDLTIEYPLTQRGARVFVTGGDTSLVITEDTVLDGNKEYELMDGIVIGADDVVLDCDGALVKGKFANRVGIVLVARNNVTIKNCRIQGFSKGIEIISSSNNNFISNSITGGIGISLEDSDENAFVSNSIKTLVAAIVSSNSNKNIYDENEFSGMIELMSSHNNSIRNNSINSKGVLLSDSHHNSIVGNTITEAEFGGIVFSLSSNDFIGTSSNNFIGKNQITGNNIGVCLHYSKQGNNNVFQFNNITNNKEGVRVSIRTDETDLFFEYEADLFFEFNNIYGNYDYNFRNGPNNVSAQNNYWGTTDTEEIENGIWDFYDDVSRGIVTYTPYLDSPWKMCDSYYCEEICTPSWFCTHYDLSGQCVEVTDVNDCFAKTGLQNHKYWGDYSEFGVSSPVFNVSVASPTMNITLAGIDITKWKTATGLLKVHFEKGGKKVAEFAYNFSKGAVDFDDWSVEQPGNESGAVKGYIIIRGIDTSALFNKTKTLYLNNLNKKMNWICIKDAPIQDISEISKNCNDAANEYHINCNGVEKNGYTCSYNSTTDQYKITGLKHSGIIQAEAPKKTPKPSPSGGGGGRGYCRESWQCTQWSSCYQGTQTRTCTDISSCGTTAYKPDESQSCTQPENTQLADNAEQATTQEYTKKIDYVAETKSEPKITGAYAFSSPKKGSAKTAIIVLISMMAIGAILLFGKKK